MANENTTDATASDTETKSQRALELRLLFRNLAKKNKKVEDEFNATDYGEDLHVVSHILHAMTVTNTALSFKKGASSLFLSLYLVTIGITTEHTSGFVGPALEKIIKKLTEGLLNEALWKPRANIEAEMFLEKLITITLISALMGGHLLGTVGIGLSVENKKQVLQFSTELLLILIASSRVLKETFKELIESCGGDEKTQNQIAEILEFVVLVSLIKGVGKETKQSLGSLYETLYRYLVNLLQRIDKLVAETLPEAEVNVAIQQAKLALAAEKFEDFVAATEDFLGTMGITKDQLEKDIDQVNELADLYYDTCTTAPTDLSSMGTGITVVA